MEITVRTIGSRELKAKLGEVLRQVREEGQTFVVTHHGRAVARLVPEHRVDDEATELNRLWSELDALAAEISREWPEGLSAAEAVSEDRREL